MSTAYENDVTRFNDLRPLVKRISANQAAHETDTYAGRSLATVFADEIAGYSDVWAWLRARVRAGNFERIRIGDWIDVLLTGENQTVRYLVGAVDPYYQCADQSKGHHIAMVPKTPVVVNDAEWQTTSGTYLYWASEDHANNNGTAEQAAPYLVSNLHEWETDVYYPKLPDAVKAVILNQRMLLETRYSSSGLLTDSTSWSWLDMGPVWSLSETEVYGQCVWGTKAYSVGLDCHFPLFRLSKDRLQGSRINWWLRSVASGSSSGACCVNHDGNAYSYSVRHTWIRPRPCFLVG